MLEGEQRTFLGLGLKERHMFTKMPYKSLRGRSCGVESKATTYGVGIPYMQQLKYSLLRFSKFLLMPWKYWKTAQGRLFLDHAGNTHAASSWLVWLGASHETHLGIEPADGDRSLSTLPSVTLPFEQINPQTLKGLHGCSLETKILHSVKV